MTRPDAGDQAGLSLPTKGGYLSKATLSWGHRHEDVTVTELSPEQAAPVIKSMLDHAPKMIRDYFDVTAESSLEAIERDAPNHAVFAVNPILQQKTRDAVVTHTL